MFSFLTKYRPGYLPAIGWFLLSTALLCMPGSGSPKYNWLLQIHFDKWVHVGIFGVLVTLLCWGFWSHSNKQTVLSTPFVLFAGVATAYGIGIEYMQDGWIPNRSFDLFDIWADAAGAAIGAWFSHWRFGKK